ncbi:SDR family NAD(P)-dependent oxidoreductase, partial [Nostoc sp. NIES-2111]
MAAAQTLKIPSVNLHLSGLTAVVTGGSSGIGAAIVTTMAAEGCNVAFCGRDSTKIEKMLAMTRSLPGKVSGRSVDVGDSASLSRWFKHIGSFDIFIPNVSALSSDWGTSMDVDMRATVEATELALP